MNNSVSNKELRYLLNNLSPDQLDDFKSKLDSGSLEVRKPKKSKKKLLYNKRK